MLVLIAVVVLTLAGDVAVGAPRPHIVVIIADDMGSNDVSFHGSNQFTTPNLDALAYNGVILNRHYSQQSCTPSRAALLTGQYPIRTGFQGVPMSEGEDRFLPLDVPLLPELLKKMGYKTHLVGKWHLGAGRRINTPTGRGFDSHFGYWGGWTGYKNYITEQEDAPGNTTYVGFDLKENFKNKWDYQGKYATEVFTEKAVEVIQKHNGNDPLFLMVAHLAVHTGTNQTVEVPCEDEMNDKLGHIENLKRRRYADALLKMDDSVGSIIEKLQDKNMLANSVVLFISDNGGQTGIIYSNDGSNWPYRGEKMSLMEGGVHNIGILFSPLLKQKNYVHDELLHITDWLPTFFNLAGGDLNSLKIDGVDQWASISRKESSRRKELLINIDERKSYSGILGSGGKYKLLNGTFSNGIVDKHIPEPKDPTTPEYNIEAIIQSKTNQAIKKLSSYTLTSSTVEKLRKISSEYKNNPRCKNPTDSETCSGFCLFDLHEDPCETQNLINDESHRGITQDLKGKLAQFWKEMVPQGNKPVDVKSNPRLYNGTWCSWLDDALCTKTTIFHQIYNHLVYYMLS